MRRLRRFLASACADLYRCVAKQDEIEITFRYATNARSLSLSKCCKSARVESIHTNAWRMIGTLMRLIELMNTD